jgi:hypothetical protein
LKKIEDRSALPFDRLTALRDIEGLAAREERARWIRR